MIKHDWLRSTAIIALAGGLSFTAPALAQDAPDETDDRVVVTGSFIAGTPEDAALPVQVTTREDLQAIGNPTLTQFILDLAVSSGIDGQTNQFTSNGLEGTSNINLRGLGPGRTLVLINGRRQVSNGFSIPESAELFVDTNLIPVSSIGRIEILKDGAAATYGSDAIAGVVNIITRNDLDGFEIMGDYSWIQNSNGNFTTALSYGWQGSDSDFFITAGFQRQSELSTRDRDFALRSFAENPEGGYSSIGNPGSYISLVDGSFNPDVNCEAVGGTLTPPFCRFQFTPFDNLQEIENRYQVFTSYNKELWDGIDFHFEALYAKTDIPEWKTSPSYPPQVLTGQVVLPDHPGLQQYVADNPQFADSFANGVIFFGRSFGWSGFPGSPSGAQEGGRSHEMARVSTGLNGTFEDWFDWDFGVTYSRVRSEVVTPDTFIENQRLALLGLGGNDCNPATGTPGVGGCLYYNPFSNAFPRGFFGGENPQFNPALANSEELGQYLTGYQSNNVLNELFVADLVLSGATPFDLWGGNVGWAAGVQFRRDMYDNFPGDLTDVTQRPCPVEGDFSCTQQTGPFSFLAASEPFASERNAYAVFGELALPVTDDIDIQFAARYEAYSGGVDSTFDPKVQVRWQATDWLALRGSAQTTFRAPTLNQLGGQFTTLQFVGAVSAFKAVDQTGNPDLSGESAFSFNLGAIFDFDWFRATVDYWSFDFDDPIIVEPQEAIVNAAVAALAAGDLDNPILDRITFDGDAAIANIARIQADVVNGPNIQTSGIDGSFEFLFDDFKGGALTLGGQLSYTLEYEIDGFSVAGTQVASAIDAVGRLNRSTFVRSIPQWKGDVRLGYQIGRHNFTVIARHVTSYEDERPFITGPGEEIDSWTTVDLHWNMQLPWNTLLSLSATNISDEDPPFARLDLNYDPYTHNPLGRVVKIGVTKQFGQPF